MSGKLGRSGRKALSAEDHYLRGTYRPDKHGPLPPGFERSTARAVAAIPFAVSAPEHLNEAERKVWRLVDPRGFSPLQLLQLEMLCVHTVRHREAVTVISAEAVRLVRQEAVIVHRLAEALAPAWRAGRVASRPAAAPADEFSEFDKGA